MESVTFIWKGSIIVPSRKWKIYPQNHFRWWSLPKWENSIECLDAVVVINSVLKLRKATANYRKNKPKRKPFIIRIFCPKQWTSFDKNLLINLLVVSGMFTYIFLAGTF